MIRHSEPVPAGGEVTLPRGCQVVMGLVLGLFGVVLTIGAVSGGISALRGKDPELRGPFTWSMVAVLSLVGPWCAITAWRLISGTPRPDGGLISPLALLVIGLACMAGAWLSYRNYGLANRTWLVLSGVAVSVFSLAIRRVRSAGKAKAA
jgi:hypothetical protein